VNAGPTRGCTLTPFPGRTVHEMSRQKSGRHTVADEAIEARPAGPSMSSRSFIICMPDDDAGHGNRAEHHDRTVHARDLVAQTVIRAVDDVEQPRYDDRIALHHFGDLPEVHSVAVLHHRERFGERSRHGRHAQLEAGEAGAVGRLW
jgi:hypothetical protein